MQLVFTWDAGKAQLNQKKHRVSFEEAKTLFSDPFLLTYPDEFHSDAEERWISIGTSARQRVLLVVHAEQKPDSETLVIRLISCRKATPLERKFYEEAE